MIIEVIINIRPKHPNADRIKLSPIIVVNQVGDYRLSNNYVPNTHLFYPCNTSCSDG